MQKLQTVAAVVAVLALLGIVGAMDYEDQQAEQAHYCEMVKAGFWPDYQGTYRRECRTPTNGQR